MMTKYPIQICFL